MRRRLVIAIVAVLVGVGAAPEARPGGSKEAQIYVQVLRRYLGTPAENSFPGPAFTKVYVLDRAYPDAGDPGGKHDRGTPITPDVQRRISAEVAGVAFVPGRESVTETKDGCAQVREGGILMVLGPVGGDDHEVRVAVNGFVACLGATWLTYIVRNQRGGWRVTGTTGTMAIS